MPSSLERAIRERLARFLAGEASLREFDAWFSPATLNVEFGDDHGANDLTWEIMLRLAEYSNGDRDLHETKLLLREFAAASSQAAPAAR